MSFGFGEIVYRSLLGLAGNAEVPRDAQPRIRGALHSSAADLTHSSDYFPHVYGKFLVVHYLDSSFELQTVTVSFTTPSGDGSMSIDNVLSTINAAGGSNFHARMEDGYLVLLHGSVGDKYGLKLSAYSDSSLDAAPYLGFSVYPSVRGTSLAGDLSSTPGVPTQNNPHGTCLIGKDEDLTSAGVNRAIFGVAEWFDSLTRAFEREIQIPVRVGPFSVGGGNVKIIGGNTYLYLDDETLRLPIDWASSSAPSGLDLADRFTVLASADNSQKFRTSVPSFGRVAVISVLYGLPTATAVDTSKCFPTWLAPGSTAYSIYGDTGGVSPVAVTLLPKHTDLDTTHETEITAIDGNILTCARAQFQTCKVQPGDHLRISGATNVLPFSHNGEFIIEKVFNEETLAVRRVDDQDTLLFSPKYLAPRLNAHKSSDGETYGTVFIPIGNSLPAKNILLRVGTGDITSWLSTVKMNVLVSKKLREVTRLSDLVGSADSVMTALYIHESLNTTAHSADHITVDPAHIGNWADASHPTQTNAEALFNAIITTLAATSGAAKVGAAAYAGSTYSLSNGTVQSQLDALLDAINDHAALPVHSGSSTVGPFPDWYPANDNVSSTNPPTADSVANVIEAIISNLASSTAADAVPGSITGSSSPTFPLTITSGHTLVFHSIIVSGAPQSNETWTSTGATYASLTALVSALNAALTNIIADEAAGRLVFKTALGGANQSFTLMGTSTALAEVGYTVADHAAIGIDATYSGAHRIGSIARSNWADGNTNAATSVFYALKQIILDLASTSATSRGDGTSKIGGKDLGSGPLISAGTLRSQIAKIVGEDGFNQVCAVLSKINVFTAMQSFSPTDRTVPAQTTSVLPEAAKRKLWWRLPCIDNSGTITYFRAYVIPGGFEFTFNAVWDGTADTGIANNWSRDNVAKAAALLRFEETGLTIKVAPTGSGSWSWADTGRVDGSGVADFTTALLRIPFNSTGATTEAQINGLYPQNTVKAWGLIELHGGSVVGSAPLAGNNIYTVFNTGPTLLVTCGTTFYEYVDTNDGSTLKPKAIIHITSDGGSDIKARWYGQASAGFKGQFIITNLAGTGLPNGGANQRIHISIIGYQY